MSPLGRFLFQPSKDYRNFHLVYGFLGAHFIVAALSYLVDPDAAVAGFVELGGLLGGEYYPLYEKSYLWRILAATNVLTLGFLCFFIQADVERHWPALYPLLFMKGTTAVCFLGVFAFALRYPSFLAVAAWDGINCLAFLYYGTRARAAARLGAEELFPRPIGRSTRPLGGL